MITVGIPSFNAVKYLPYILERLQHQKIPNLPVIIWDNGSWDGTVGYVSNVLATNYWAKKSQEKNGLNLYFFTKPQDSKQHPYVNAMAARKQIAALTKTPYLFFLDPDVLIRQMSLPRLKEELDESGAAYIGMKYEPDAMDHPQHRHIMLGATLWKTDVFQSLPVCTNEDIKKGCDCVFCYRAVEKTGQQGVHSRFNAEHLKGVFV